jgi:antitoxin FitA
MASLTIRNLEEGLKRKLRVRAAEHGRSMEEEARHILRDALGEAPRSAPNLYAAIRARIEPLGGVELPIPKRGSPSEPPRFDE